MNNDFIECNYYPEGYEPSGYMRIKVSDGKEDCHIKPEGKNTVYGVIHVMKKLKQLASIYASNIDNLPSERTVMWY